MLSSQAAHVGDAPPRPCPVCLSLTRPESDEEIRERTRDVVDDPRRVGVTTSLDLAWANHQEKLVEAGHALPGSIEEDNVIERIDVLREQEQERRRERKRNRGTLVRAGIENGVWTEYRAVRVRGGHQIVRYPPEASTERSPHLP